jgi:hypothetical protein
LRWTDSKWQVQWTDRRDGEFSFGHFNEITKEPRCAIQWTGLWEKISDGKLEWHSLGKPTV